MGFRVWGFVYWGSKMLWEGGWASKPAGLLGFRASRPRGLRAQPKTLNPKPQTPNPKPQTLNPNLAHNSKTALEALDQRAGDGAEDHHQKQQVDLCFMGYPPEVRRFGLVELIWRGTLGGRGGG